MVPLSLSLLFLISKVNLFRTYHLSALKIPIFPYPFTHLNSWNSYPFIYLKPEKGTLYPFRVELPRERVPPLGSHMRINKRESMKNKTCWASYRVHDIPSKVDWRNSVGPFHASLNNLQVFSTFTPLKEAITFHVKKLKIFREFSFNLFEVFFWIIMWSWLDLFFETSKGDRYICCSLI